MTLLEHNTDTIERSTESLAYELELLTRLKELERYDWSLHARPEQLPPDGQWNVWLILAGRGWGKTRTGAEWIKAQALAQANSRWAVVAPTFADIRDTCLEGESGLLSVIPKEQIKNYNRSTAELDLVNGSRIKGFSADEPDRLRGPQHHGAWVDELAAWRYPEAWDQLQFGLRLGRNPRSVVTTTPKPTRLVRSLVERASQDNDSVSIIRGQTWDNRDNLAPAALEELKNRYEGTRLGRQELYAELLTDTPGALWTYDLIERNRVSKAIELSRVVVAIDPAVTSGEESDETGIVVAGLGTDGTAYILSDLSGRYSPDTWADRAIGAFDKHSGDRIIAEVNNGGDLVERVVRTKRANIAYKAVRASKGKLTRAEPVAALYEQGKVHHVGVFPELEEQLTTWTPDAGKSPDRLDSLVWAITELMLEPNKPKMRFRG